MIIFQEETLQIYLQRNLVVVIDEEELAKKANEISARLMELRRTNG